MSIYCLVFFHIAIVYFCAGMFLTKSNLAIRTHTKSIRHGHLHCQIKLQSPIVRYILCTGMVHVGNPNGFKEYVYTCQCTINLHL